VDLSLGSDSLLELETVVKAQLQGGLIFDQYSPTDFKFVTISPETGQLVIGHYTNKKGWSVDAAVSKTLNANSDYTLAITLKGRTISVRLNGQAVAGYAFNGLVVDGGFGLLSARGTSSFDKMTVKTDDPAFAPEGGTPMLAAYAPLGKPSEATLTQAELNLVVAEALQRWTEQYGTEPLAEVSFEVSDLRGLALGEVLDNTVRIDATAAGHGWSLSGEVGKMNLLVVVMHEVGHVMGLEHTPGLGSQTELMGVVLAPQGGTEQQAFAAEMERVAAIGQTYGSAARMQRLTLGNVQRTAASRSGWRTPQYSRLLTNHPLLRYIERWKKFSRQSVEEWRFSRMRSGYQLGAYYTWK
jgi:hypothetical protein